MIETLKLQKAIDLLAQRTGLPHEYIIQFFEKNGISQNRIYKGLDMMAYIWNGEQWVHCHKLPNWYHRLKGGFNADNRSK